jgi:hypothetical protein
MRKFIAGLVFLCMASCSIVADKKINKDEIPAVYGAQVGIVNHTDRYIYSAGAGDGGGGHANAYSAGIANICCVTMPDKWRPGLKLLVSWDVPDGRRHIVKKKLVEVERYEEPGSVYIHFFSDDQIRIVITNWYGGAPQHPISPPVMPESFAKSRMDYRND